MSVNKVSAQRSFFKSVPGSHWVSTDLHIHTVFSDGAVWPSIRVEEARREGLDLIAMTEHLEYQPHSDDIPHPNRNRSFIIANGMIQAGEQLQVINGSEITREMAPGHINNEKDISVESLKILSEYFVYLNNCLATCCPNSRV